MTTQSQIQSAFNSGEWSPKLYSRVDMAKYKTGAALLQNWFVDYRGGASTRPGTRYILQCRVSSKPVRLIPFQASFTVGYVLEFGDNYIRFYNNGSPVLEPTFSISAATQANPCVITVPGHNYSIGDWIFIASVTGMTQLNGRYFIISNVAGNNLTLTGLTNSNIDSTTYGAYVSGGTTARVYTISSPYLAADLSAIKFAQNVTQMVLCHPSYTPYILTLNTATNWTLAAINFGSTATIPTSVTSSSTLAAGSVVVSYVVTSINAQGDESPQSGVTNPGATADLRTTPGTNIVTWGLVASAVGYNVYKSEPTYSGSTPTGALFGFIGSTIGNSFQDSNIAPDFTTTPPIVANPFLGNGIARVDVFNSGTYTSVPAVTLSGAGFSIPASLSAVLVITANPTVSAAGSGYAVNDTIVLPNNVTVRVTAIGGGGSVSTVVFTNQGSVTSGSTPSNPVVQVSTSGAGTGATFNCTWGVGKVVINNPGAGYNATPTVNFSSGAAVASAVLGNNSGQFPTVPGFFQERLVLAGPTNSPQTLYFSQPGSFFNYNTSNPIQADNAITATLVSGQLNTIKSMIPQTSGLLVLSDRASWLINGGSPGAPISPSAFVANTQSFNGVSDIPPIIANYDVLYVQAKGSIVRDSSYNIYANVYTGSDISIISSHLFYGFTITGWAWAEEPFKTVWAVRSDGTLLTLTFLKEQDFIGWAHSTTLGLFKSVTTIVESTSSTGNVDSVYTIVQRTVNGSTVQYIERVAERTFNAGITDAWCVDCGLQYNGSPVLSFTGAEQLAGLTCTGLATDNLGNVTIITPFVMPATGFFTLPAPTPIGATGYTRVTLGIGYNCDLQTLAIDMGEPTIQGKVKKISDVVVRCSETLGLQIGSSFSTLVPMKDLVLGNISSMLTGQSSQVITGLVTGDAKTILDPTYTVPGQYCIRQSNPYPATITGVIPTIVESSEARRSD